MQSYYHFPWWPRFCTSTSGNDTNTRAEELLNQWIQQYSGGFLDERTHRWIIAPLAQYRTTSGYKSKGGPLQHVQMEFNYQISMHFIPAWSRNTGCVCRTREANLWRWQRRLRFLVRLHKSSQNFSRSSIHSTLISFFCPWLGLSSSKLVSGACNVQI